MRDRSDEDFFVRIGHIFVRPFRPSRRVYEHVVAAVADGTPAGSLPSSSLSSGGNSNCFYNASLTNLVPSDSPATENTADRGSCRHDCRGFEAVESLPVLCERLRDAVAAFANASQKLGIHRDSEEDAEDRKGRRGGRRRSSKRQHQSVSGRAAASDPSGHVDFEDRRNENSRRSGGDVDAIDETEAAEAESDEVPAVDWRTRMRRQHEARERARRRAEAEGWGWDFGLSRLLFGSSRDAAGGKEPESAKGKGRGHGSGRQSSNADSGGQTRAPRGNPFVEVTVAPGAGFNDVAPSPTREGEGSARRPSAALSRNVTAQRPHVYPLLGGGRLVPPCFDDSLAAVLFGALRGDAVAAMEGDLPLPEQWVDAQPQKAAVFEEKSAEGKRHDGVGSLGQLWSSLLGLGGGGDDKIPFSGTVASSYSGHTVEALHYVCPAASAFGRRGARAFGVPPFAAVEVVLLDVTLLSGV